MTDYNKVSTLQERDLELQKQLNDINNASVKKLMKKAPELPIVETKKKKLMTNTPQAIADLALRDLAFQVQLDDIAEKAVGSKDITPYKVNREITPEMIADFEETKNVPFEVGGQKFSYNPSALTIDLVKPVFHVLGDDYKNVEEIALTVEPYIVRLTQDYEDFKARIVKNKAFTKQTNDKYITDKSKLEAELKLKRKANTKAPVEAKIKKLDGDFKVAMTDLADELKQFQTDMSNIERALKQVETDRDDEIRKFEENQGELDRVDRINKERIGSYIQDIQALNVGLNVSRDIGETDEHFAERLMNLSQPLVSSGEEEEAIKRKQFLRMKSLLGKLITDTAKAEATTKLSPAEQFEYIKREPVINKKFLEVYGFNNKRVSESDIADFIRMLINENPIALVSSSGTTTKTISPSKTIKEEPDVPVVPFSTPESSAKVQGRVELRAFLEKRLREPPYGMQLSKSITGIRELLKVALDYKIKIPEEVIDKIHGGDKQELARRVNKILSKEIPEPLQAEPDVQFGVGVKQYPKLVKFGKIYISADELYYKNILKIRNSKKHAIVGIPNVKVSEDLATILLKIIDGGKVSKSNLNLLSNKERHVYDQICIMSGLHKTLDNTFDTTAQELKQQLEVVEGEIMAGNNNPELLKEVHKLLWTMNSVGLIAGNTALKHFKEVKKNYF